MAPMDDIPTISRPAGAAQPMASPLQSSPPRRKRPRVSDPGQPVGPSPARLRAALTRADGGCQVPGDGRFCAGQLDFLTRPPAIGEEEDDLEEPGALRKPLVWTDLERLIRQRSFEKLGNAHSLLQIRENCASRQEILDTYATVGDYVLVTVVGLDTNIDENDKVVAVSDSMSKRTVFDVSIFPCFLEDGIEQHCIWSTGVLSASEVEEILLRELPEHEVICFVSQKRLKNIPEADILQVFSRRLGSGAALLGKLEFFPNLPLSGLRLRSARSMATDHEV